MEHVSEGHRMDGLCCGKPEDLGGTRDDEFV